jgi:oligopeptide transport system substrate-binding protein
MKRITNLLFVLIMILGLVACGGSPAPAATASPPASSTPLPSITPSPTLTPTPLPTSTPTLTPTITPRPTRTSIPTATPMPVGFVASKEYGFSLVHGDGWKEITESGFYHIENRELFSDFYTNSWIENVATPLSALVSSLRNSSFFASSKINTQYTTSLADGSKAEAEIIDGKNKNGTLVTMVVVVARHNLRTFEFVLYGTSQDYYDNKDLFDKMIKSISLDGVELYGAVRDQTLRLYGYSDPDPEELDPAITESGAVGLVGLLYSGLVSLTPDLKIAPDLAENWTISPDGTVYTFTLRYDLAFQDERPITAKDVKYSWERATDPKTKSKTASTYLGDILGVKEKLAGKAQEISGVQVVDDHTLVVKLDAPKPYFLAKLTFPTSFVVDEKSVIAGGDSWVFKPNASGPFKLLDYEKGTIILFERNMAYHTPPKLPYIAYILNFTNNPLDYYQSNEIDIADWFNMDEVKKVHDASFPLHNEVQSVTSMCTYLLQMNNTLPPMDDLNVRKAFALALDRQRLIDQFGGDNFQLADTILPPSMPGFSTDLKMDSFDAKAAKDALAASRYATKLPKVVLNLGGYANKPSDYAKAMVSMWQKNLGVNVQVEYLDPTDYTKTAHDQHGQMVLYGWCADYPDPQNFLDVLYHTDSSFNVSGYTNPDVDKLLEQARVESDTAKRLALYQKVESMLLSDYAAVPIDHSIYTMMAKPKVKGVIASPIGTRKLDLVELVQ